MTQSPMSDDLISFAYVMKLPLKNGVHALAGVAQWVERWPVKQRVAGLIPSQGTCLGGRPGPWWGVGGM